MEKDIKIAHGFYWMGESVYRSNKEKELDIPTKFQTLLSNKTAKWVKQRYYIKKGTIIPFTLGKLELENKRIYAIAIVHPRDRFNRKIGTMIVKGRILKEVKDGYSSIPELKPKTIEVIHKS